MEMDYSTLIEALAVAVVGGVNGLIVPTLLFYPIFRRRGVADVSKHYAVDSSRIDKGNAARVWLRIFKPWGLSLNLPSSELGELVETCHDKIYPQVTGHEESPEEVKSQAIAELLENHLVRSYLLA